MRIGSSSDSIYQLLAPRPKRNPAADDTAQKPAPSVKTVDTSSSDDALVAAFQARLAQSSFDRNDTNHDGYVDQNEFIDNNMQKRPDGYQPQLADVQRYWSAIDSDNQGRLGEADYKDAFSSVLKVSLGHLD